MKNKFVWAYMDVARRFSELSSAVRLQVGSIIVKDDRIISIGYNGTPAGWDNNCEDKEYMDRGAGGWLDPEEIEMQWPFRDERGRYRLKTKPEVLHAERNALDKLAKQGGGGDGATMFVTHAPCLECAKSIYGAGIKELYYAESYRSDDGVDFLNRAGVLVTHVKS